LETQEKDTAFIPYKFRELKVYSSTEWLADNKKKYRQVFDRYDTTYVYAELSFFNKLFDIDVWDIEINLKCFRLGATKKEICSLEIKRKVSKFDHTVFVREGWGNKKEGAFWKKGTYFWEAWIGKEKVATKYFYIENAGSEITEKNNPYIDLTSLRLYEGQYDDVPAIERKYYKTFSAEETRYIYAEIQLDNKNAGRNWQCELFAKFYNEARELKGQVIRLQSVKKDEEEIEITAGWGSNVKGSWRPGKYTVEIVFMDRLLGIIPFSVGETFQEGTHPVQVPHHNNPILLVPDDQVHMSFDELMKQLDRLIGLGSIKAQVRDHSNYLQFVQLRKEKGFEERDEINVHSVFVGNPGTGKTTVAQMMGKLYKKMGLLSKGHVHSVDRVDLVGEYIGQTAPKVREAIEKARGGVLFIDEAYALARVNDDSKDFGREVIEILVKEMSNGAGDLAIIVAGYPKEMEHFLNSNPGLKSRFKLHFKFPDYLPDELSRIAEFAAKEKEVTLSPEAKELVDKIIVNAYRNRDRSFGNARFVYDLVEKAKINLGLRIMQSQDRETLTRESFETIKQEDVVRLDIKPSDRLLRLPVDDVLLEESLKELDDLIGIDTIKSEINELVQLVKYYHASGKHILHKMFLHTVFIGNPGTGKTTVARILTRIYRALGILERGHMIETDRQGLVAGFVGQTALKTAEKIEEAMGGVLFIDEAYSLSSHPGSHADYGNEVIQTILKRMEDHRGKFFIFAAGYPDNMEQFLKANPGLSSRFDKTLKFSDYAPAELSQIGVKMMADEGFHATPKSLDHLAEYFEWLYDFRDKYFGNARTVRQVIHEVIKNQQLRMAAMDDDERKKRDPNRIIFDDVKIFGKDTRQFVFNRQAIGFRKK
jgi:SpoVK/Ycf46/Vps4 family AAA+-type ATPase